MRDSADGPYVPTKRYWWAVRVGFSILILILLGIRSLLPDYPVDAITIGLVALLIFVWVLPYLTKFSLPGGVAGELVGVPAPPREVPRPGKMIADAGRGERESLSVTLRERMQAPQTPEQRSFYSTLIETAVFLKLENEYPPPDYQVQRYPIIIVDGKQTGFSFHAVVRSRLWPGRRFCLVENAVGEIAEDRIYRVLEDLRSRAEFTNRVLGNAPNEYVLILVSDLRGGPEKREWFNRAINQGQSAVAIPRFSSVLWDLSDLPV